MKSLGLKWRRNQGKVGDSLSLEEGDTFGSLGECTTNSHPMFKVSGPERHPIVSPATIFCLVMQFSSPAMDLVWFVHLNTWLTNILADSVDWYSPKGCTNYTRSQLDTLRHKTKKLYTLFMTPDPILFFSCKYLFLRQKFTGSPQGVLSKNKEWSSSSLEIMLGFLSLLLCYIYYFSCYGKIVLNYKIPCNLSKSGWSLGVLFNRLSSNNLYLKIMKNIMIYYYNHHYLTYF